MKRITKTIGKTKVNLTAYDIEKKVLVNETVTLKDVTTDTTLKEIQKFVKIENLTIVDFSIVETTFKKYAMDLATFLEKATKIDGLKIGNINRTIKEYVYQALIVDYDDIEKGTNPIKKISLTLDKKIDDMHDAVTAIRKEYENDTIRIIDAFYTNTINGMYTISESDFIKYGYEIDINDNEE